MEPITPVASASGSTVSRSVSMFGEGGLSVGQVIRARVTRIEGDTVQLRWGDQTVSVASRVPLTVGQQVSMMVEVGSTGKMLLRLVDDSAGNGRPAGTVPESRTNGTLAGTADPRASGARGTPGPATGAALTPGRAALPAADGEALTTLLFERLDGSAARLAGTGRGASTDAMLTGAATGAAAGGLVARAAMPTYGRLAQSVGGPAAFGQLMATLGHEVGQTLARAPLAPADLGRLLMTVGVHPDAMNAALVGEMLAQGIAVSEANVRGIRRGLASAGGSPRDAAPAVALARLGLPITSLSLAVARQMLTGQLQPSAAWGELLMGLQRLSRGTNGSSQAGVLASELLADWRIPLEEGTVGVSRWLRAAVDQAATPLEAKLARSPIVPGGEQGPATTPSQDARARLDLLAQALPSVPSGERSSLAEALQRTQATVQAEQILNGASAERSEQRFFAVTLPTVVDQQPSTLELRVRERDAQAGPRGDGVQPDAVQMKLSLPGLGDLGVSLLVGQHSIACHFSASSPFAEALLNASSGELVGRLKRLGFAHTAVDAAHESPEATPPTLAATPRVNHVDLKA